MSQKQRTLSISPIEACNPHDCPGINPVIRSDFRLPLDPEDEVSVRYQGKRFAVHNLSEHGLQLESNADQAFFQEQSLDDLQLYFGNHSATIQGKTIYSFQISPDCFLYGVDILSFGSSKEKELLKAFLRQKKEQLFVK
ncbi:MAG: hypothetical protein ACQEQX_09875 [Thermodesulfobacteriota bacterium]